MASIRELAACLELPGNFSILQDFFGYITPVPQPISLLRQAQLLQGPYINLNLIQVGVYDGDPQRVMRMNVGLQFTRQVYDNVDLGIGRVDYYELAASEKVNGFTIITSGTEAIDLTNEWFAPGYAIDAFFVIFIADALGYTTVDGPCNKSQHYQGFYYVATGVVVATDMPGNLGITLAHEIGHYLGLEHQGDVNNLMYEGAVATQLAPWQAEKIKGHCFVLPGCGSQLEVEGGGFL